ncbi:hypothetical protein BaRGS_00030607, partial [Batillaria attramentaria]
TSLLYSHTYQRATKANTGAPVIDRERQGRHERGHTPDPGEALRRLTRRRGFSLCARVLPTFSFTRSTRATTVAHVQFHSFYPSNDCCPRSVSLVLPEQRLLPTFSFTRSTRAKTVAHVQFHSFYPSNDCCPRSVSLVLPEQRLLPTFSFTHSTRATTVAHVQFHSFYPSNDCCP